MLVNLNYIFDYWNKGAVAGFNVYGYEDALAVTRAAEKLNAPVILMTNRDALKHMPMNIFAPMLRTIAEESKVPVCVHLDHCSDIFIAKQAISFGYTSVMFDGSQLPIEENIAYTAELISFAHDHNVSVEAEIGSVGYADPEVIAEARFTAPEDIVSFLEHAPVDALAVAVGTVHRMTAQTANIDFDLLSLISAQSDVPIVIHGSSGVPDDQLHRLALCGAKKVNIGTSLRLAFGNTLRKQFSEQPDAFDRIKLFPACMDAVTNAAVHKMQLLMMHS